jgi:hypothetical protein
MVFKKYAAFFTPYELDALTSAYVAVWQQVRAAKHVRACEASVLKNNLAQIILASACTALVNVTRNASRKSLCARC